MKRFLKILLGLILVAAFGLMVLLHHHEILRPSTGQLACAARLLAIEGTDRLVEGPEDIVVDRARGLAYISAYNRFKVEEEVAAGGPVVTEGGIYALALGDLAGSGAIRVRDLSAGFAALQPFRPHGLALYSEGEKGAALFVVNHRHVVESGGVRDDPTIEIFDLEGETIEDLGAPAATVRHPLLCSPNDLAALDRRRFLASNDHGACTPGGQFLEDLLARRKAYVVAVEAGQPRIVADGIGYANGLALTPAGEGPRKLLVAATRDKAVLVYDLEALLAGPGGALPERRIELPGGPDNFAWDAAGRLYLAVFPNLYRFAAFMRGWFGIDHAPGGFLALDWRKDEKPGYLHIFSGGSLNGVTVAAPHGEWVMAASGFDNKLMVCESPPDA